MLLALTLGACQRDSVKAQAETSDPVVVSMSKSARVKQSGELKVTKIEDSRCPANVVCIQYGSAKVFFTLTNNGASKTGELCLGQCGSTLKSQDTAALEVGGTQFEILLTEVRPFPGTSPTPVEPEAVVKITTR